MKQFKSVKDYKTATDTELMQHLISEIKAIKNDKELMRYLDFDQFHQKNECGTYHCLAGHMSIRSGIPVQDRYTGDLTKDFLFIFAARGSYYSKALPASTDSDERNRTWDSIFGVTDQGGTLEDRLERAEEILEDLNLKEN